MKSMRRFGLVLIVLFLGIIIGNFGLRTALLVFVPLFTLWFMLWDEKNTVNHNVVNPMKTPSITKPITAPGTRKSK